MLSRQVSNLNSSDPESDVLPITLRDKFEAANIKNLFKMISKQISKIEGTLRATSLPELRNPLVMSINFFNTYYLNRNRWP